MLKFKSNKKLLNEIAVIGYKVICSQTFSFSLKRKLWFNSHSFTSCNDWIYMREREREREGDNFFAPTPSTFLL